MVSELEQACTKSQKGYRGTKKIEQACTNSQKGYIGFLQNRTGLFYFVEGDVFEPLSPNVL